jgi:hypothetical protein
VREFGFFFYLIYPGAFVNLDEEELDSKTEWEKIKIYCAGVWHNFVLCFLALFLLKAIIPTFVIPIFYEDQYSSVYPKGLYVSDLPHVKKKPLVNFVFENNLTKKGSIFAEDLGFGAKKEFLSFVQEVGSCSHPIDSQYTFVKCIEQSYLDFQDYYRYQKEYFRQKNQGMDDMASLPRRPTTGFCVGQESVEINRHQISKENKKPQSIHFFNY